MEEEVNMCVDEAGHERVGAEVDDAGICGMGHCAADGGDAVALDEDFSGRDEGAALRVEQVRGVEDDGGR